MNCLLLLEMSLLRHFWDKYKHHASASLTSCLLVKRTYSACDIVPSVFLCQNDIENNAITHVMFFICVIL